MLTSLIIVAAVVLSVGATPGMAQDPGPTVLDPSVPPIDGGAPPVSAAPTPPPTPSTATTITDDGVRITRNVTTSTLATDPPIVLTADIYQPSDKAPVPAGGRPAVVLVHGGSWFQGEPSNMDEPGRLVAEQGWVAFSVSYRLAAPGKPSYPDAVGDVQRGVRWVAAHARDYGAEPDRIGMLGASAGGHLAAMVAILGTDPILSGPRSSPPGALPVPVADPPARVRVVATWSAPMVLTELVPDEGAPPFACGSSEYCQRFWTIPIVNNLLGCDIVDCKADYESASPVNRVSASTAPMWIANSDDEIVPLGQLQLMGDALIAANVPHEVQIIQGHGHANDYTGEVWNSMVPFLADQIGVPRPEPLPFPVKGDGPGGGLTVVLVTIGGLVLLLTVGIGFLTRNDDDLDREPRSLRSPKAGAPPARTTARSARAAGPSGASG